MKKSSLLGIEVYYEEKPEIPQPIEQKKTFLDEGVWVFGSPEENEDDDFRGDDFDDDYVEEIETAFNQVHSPTVGETYKVRGLPICVTYKGEVFTPFMKGKILAVSYLGSVFYIDAENLHFASSSEVEDYNNAS